MPLKSRGILGNAELQSIFSNLSVLLNVNEQLERALADMRAKKDDKVGHIFLETVLLHIHHARRRALCVCACVRVCVCHVRRQSSPAPSHCFHFSGTQHQPRQADYFKMYTQYCANQENCIRTMDLLEKKNKPFAKFLDVRHHTHQP
jgi:hypothetical protein